MCENSRVMAASDDISVFEERKPFASSAVWACAVYALVPFIGVVFFPLIFVFGVVALLRGEQSSLRAMGAGVLVLIVQLVLWWLLYLVPKWNSVL